MTTEDFRDLALRVLEGTADERDRVRLAEARTSRPEFAAEWAELERVWQVARGIAPALAAADLATAARGETPPPAPVDQLIERTIHGATKPGRHRSAHRGWWVATAAIALLFLGGVVVGKRLGVGAFESAPDSLNRPAAELVATLAPTLTRGGDPEVLILSPVVATRSVTPVIDWVARPGKSYDIALSYAEHPENPIWRATAVRPPFNWDSCFASLERGASFVVSVQEHDRPLTASQRRFTIDVREPDAGAASVDGSILEREFIAALYQSEPSRVGDAWLLWRQIPAPRRETSRGWRLYLVLTARLGWESEFQRAAAELGVAPPASR